MKTKPTGTMIGIILGGILLIAVILGMVIPHMILGLYSGHVK